MRLFDRVVQTSAPIIVEQENGARFELSGANQFVNAVAACPKRYVLDEQASALARSFAHANFAMLAPENRLLRLSSPSQWLEWWEPPFDAREHKPVRVGVLCRSDASGRRGRIRSFWQEGEDVSAAPGDIVFDLDASAGAPTPSKLALNHLTEARILPLLRHAMFEVDADWLAYYGVASGAPLDELTRCAEICWPDLPLALAFSLLLTMKRGPFAEAAQDISRLNKARARSGKPLLLDHVEVRLALDEADEPLAGHSGLRAAPRLHQVRGHPVRRGDHLYWRSAHLRGDRSGPLLHQTTSVTARRAH